MKLLKLSFPALLLIPMLLCEPQVAVGQNVYATVHGTVTDASGALVPGATVTALNTSTGITSQAVTDSKGYYVFAQLQTGGPYTISIEKSGFQTFKTTDLSLAANDNREISAKLAVGAGSQTIQVEASSVQVETSDTQLKTDINSSEIVSLPLLARNAVALQKTAPGVVEASDRFGTFSTNGSQTPQNGFLVDGVDVNDGPLQTAGVTPNPDAIGELNIITSTLNPEYNRNSGAIVSEELKTGTNRFHGSGFWFYRDTFLDNPYYFSGGKRPPYHQNLYGGTLGGPVIKDKLFFFLAYQGYRNAVSSVDNTKVPGADQLAGNFSDDIANGVVSGKTLPFAVGSCTAGETWANCFTSNGGMFSPANYNPIAAKLLQQFVPASNTTIGGAPYYRFFAATTNGDDQGIIRADWHPTANDAIWGSSIFESHPDNETIPFTGASLPGFPQNDARHIKIFNGSFTHTFSPTLVNELRAGYYRFYYAAVEPADVCEAGFLRLRYHAAESLSRAALHWNQRLFQSWFQHQWTSAPQRSELRLPGQLHLDQGRAQHEVRGPHREICGEQSVLRKQQRLFWIRRERLLYFGRSAAGLLPGNSGHLFAGLRRMDQCRGLGILLLRPGQLEDAAQLSPLITGCRGTRKRPTE